MRRGGGSAAFVAVLLLAFAGCGTGVAPTREAPSASPSPAVTPDSSQPASASPSFDPLPTIDPAATLAPSLTPGALNLSDLGWQSVVQEFDPATSEPIGHWLAIGTLDRAEPSWFKKLIESPWRFSLYAVQQPVVDGPAGGKVLYVSDDGTSSAIRMIRVDGSESAVVTSIPEVVYTARLSPDGRSAYLVVLDRDSGRDQGVWRVSLQGDPATKVVMPPPSVDLAASGGNRLAATTRFVRVLRVSPDGSLVARLACGEPYGSCVLDVLTVAGGRISPYTPPDGSGELTAVGDGVMLGIDYCLPGGRCVTSGMRLATGEAQLFAGTPPAIDADGRLVLLGFPPPTVAARGFFATQLDGSGTRLVFATDGSVRTIIQEGIFSEGVRMELPWGWVAVSLEEGSPDGRYVTTPAAVRLADGGWVPLTLPQIYPIGGGTD